MKYIAFPYNHSDQKIVELRLKQAREYTEMHLRAGNPAMCPVLYLDKFKKDFEDKGLKAWPNFCMSILRRCDQFVVLELEGWDESKGLREEIQLAQKLNIPISYVDYKTDY